jgi:hypothetical protein
MIGGLNERAEFGKCTRIAELLHIHDRILLPYRANI